MCYRDSCMIYKMDIMICNHVFRCLCFIPYEVLQFSNQNIDLNHANMEHFMIVKMLLSKKKKYHHSPSQTGNIWII